jgi:hypothetical protein
MADNVELNLGTGGKVVRSIDKGGFEAQVVVIDMGGAGAESLLTTAMPVTGTITANAGTNLNTSLLALESGGNLATLVTRTPALGQALAASSTPVVLTSAQLTTLTPLTTVAVTGTFWQATQPVSLVSVPSHAVTNAGTFAVQATQAGTWTVTGAGGTFPVTGTFWQATQPVSLATLPALPAGTNLIGKTSTAQDTSSLYNGTTALTPKFATFTTSSSGVTTVVAAVGGKKIRVLRWRVTSNGTTNVKWQSHVTPTDISGLSYLTQFKDVGGGYCPVGHFETISGEALDINNSAAVAISGEVTYIEI